ncbi:MAG: hypothetical protein HFG41_08735 [Coprococcus sp.]|nr:hypothetical protein [Coprococcus sp.]
MLQNMRFYKNLYVSGSLQKKKDKLIEKLKAGKYPLTVYLLVMPVEGKNQIEFYPAALLYQKIVSKERLFVVGLASGHEDAVYLVEDIVREVYEKTGDADIRAYIMEQEGE